MGTGVLKRYKDLLPITPSTPIFSLGEGETPLITAPRLAEKIGCKELYFKFEGCNPTGSFKDRGMVVAVAKAMEEGSKRIICASTGNTSASAAAYGAYCGLESWVVVPKGNIAMGKLAQALMYGTRVIAIEGNFDEALSIVRALVKSSPITLVNSVNPYRIEGQKTAAFEIVDELGKAPDMLCIPVGNAGNITAYWRGFVQYCKLGKSGSTPMMLGFEAAGAAPIVEGRVIESPQTVASAIRIGNPASWQGAVQARDESGGIIDSVTDEEILESYHTLASDVGVFGEPASAASLAGLFKLARGGTMDLSSKSVVCVVTGMGLKDPDTALKTRADIIETPAELEAVRNALGL
ncbi:MAG: threonine synthase [Dehalococcoidia bacterium]|nr:threonine synthase [Dehalococcoidia bacterium]